MLSTTVAIALLSSVAAADTVTTLFFPNFDQQPLVASVMGSDATATTYSIACAPDTDPVDCGVYTGFVMVQGPKTVSFEMVAGDKSLAYADVNCDLDPVASVAACTDTIGGSEASVYAGVSSFTFSSTDYASYLIPVTITAGAVTGVVTSTGGVSSSAASTESTASATTKAAASAATTASSTGSAASTASGMSTAASSSSTGASATTKAASSSSVSTGGMPQITGNAQWAMGGVAVAMALAAL